MTDIGQSPISLLLLVTTVSDRNHNCCITGATTSNLKLMGFVQRVDNTPASPYAKLLVKINNHVYGSGTGTAVI